MGIIEDIVADSLPIWNECLKTKFICQLGEGTLADEKMVKYIVEDTTYLTEYAKCFAYQITKCKTLDQMRFFYSILGFVNESETSIRRTFLASRNIDEIWAETRKPDKPNERYINHMLDATKNGSLAEGLMSILPCMLSYEYIFMKLAKKYDIKNNKYSEILLSYADPGYTETCKMWMDYTNVIIGSVDEKEKEHLMEIFHISSQCELDFWEMSFNNKLEIE